MAHAPTSAGRDVCCEVVIEAGDALGEVALNGCVHLELAPDPRSASAARRFVTAELGDLDRDTVDTVALLVSELVTNGVLHARTPLQLGLSRQGDEILIAVGDLNSSQPQSMPYSEDRTDGRGMTLVKELSDRFGIRPHDGGKSVWFTLRGRRSDTPRRAG